MVGVASNGADGGGEGEGRMTRRRTRSQTELDESENRKAKHSVLDLTTTVSEALPSYQLATVNSASEGPQGGNEKEECEISHQADILPGINSSCSPHSSDKHDVDADHEKAVRFEEAVRVISPFGGTYAIQISERCEPVRDMRSEYILRIHSAKS